MEKVKNMVACVSLTLVVGASFLTVSPALSQEENETNPQDIKDAGSNSVQPGTVLLSQKKFAEAESYFKAEMDQDDRPIGFEIGLAVSLIKQKKFPDAIKFLETATHKTPSSVVLADLYMEAVLRQPAEIRNKEDIVAVMIVAANCAERLGIIQRSIRSPSQDTDEDSSKKEVEKYFQRYPQMSCGGETEVFLRKWLSKMFAGDHEVCSIVCDESIDTPLSRAHHIYLNKGEHAVIQLPAFHGNGFNERSLASFCFEVFNVENCKAFARLEKHAMQGMLCEDEFVIETLKLEHAAILKARKFYLEELLPKMQLDGIESDPNNWLASFPLSFAYFIRALNAGQSRETWDYYAKQYRRLYSFGYWRGGLPEGLSPVAPLFVDEAGPRMKTNEKK